MNFRLLVFVYSCKVIDVCYVFLRNKDFLLKFWIKSDYVLRFVLVFLFSWYLWWGLCNFLVRLIKWCRNVWFGCIIVYVKLRSFMSDWSFCKVIFFFCLYNESFLWIFCNFFIGSWIFILLVFNFNFKNVNIVVGCIVFFCFKGIFICCINCKNNFIWFVYRER